MSGSLIIDARRLVPWPRRLCSDLSTSMMWGIWLKLWVPLWAGWLPQLAARSQPGSFDRLVSGSATQSVQCCVLALAGISGALLVWKELPANGVRAPKALALRDYARHFGLPEDAIVDGRLASVCVVHHDESGRIVRLETRRVSSGGDAIAA
jgi:poly-beta-1,6-N-acetyl-D-glucosamine biosynthesis protein PgaD